MNKRLSKKPKSSITSIAATPVFTLKDPTNPVSVSCQDQKEKKPSGRKAAKHVHAEAALLRISWLESKNKGKDKDKNDKEGKEVVPDKKSLTLKMDVAKNAFEHYPKIVKPVYVKSQKMFAKPSSHQKDVNYVDVMDAILETWTISMNILQNNTRITMWAGMTMWVRTNRMRLTWIMWISLCWDKSFPISIIFMDLCLD